MASREISITKIASMEFFQLGGLKQCQGCDPNVSLVLDLVYHEIVDTFPWPSNQQVGNDVLELRRHVYQEISRYWSLGT